MDDLDNPFWSSLATRHAHLAIRGEGVARYPAECAPFLGVEVDAAAVEASTLATLVAPGEQVYLLGLSTRAPAGWLLEAFRPLAQMVCERPVEVVDGPDIVTLGDGQRADVMALTALVYPHYFRARTMEMGRYFGIYEDGRLAAMIGERLGTAHAREMSAICTNPDSGGRGLARRLTALLGNDTLARGQLPFLHVSYENPRAMALYERLGYRLRRDIPFWKLSRPDG